MATTPEGKVKKVVSEILKAKGAYYFSPVTGGFGRAGVPDIIACYRGTFIGIECKAGKNEPTALQLRALSQINTSGGRALVINEHNVDVLTSLLLEIDINADCD